MRKIRFGLIGCGYIAEKAIVPALIKSNNAELVAVSDKDRNRAEAFSERFGCKAEIDSESLLSRDDITAVYIATVPSSHEQIILSAAEHAKHILCEKPLTISYKSTKRILKCCRDNGVGIFEGYMYQFHSQHQKARNLVNEGQIGEPVLFSASFGFPPLASDNFRYQTNEGGGALLDAGSYTIHAARHFFQREPDSIHSILNKNGNGVEIHGTVTLDFGKGQTAQLSFGFNNFYRNCYSIWGTEGLITVKRAFSIPATVKPKIILEKQDFYEEINCDADDHFIKEIDFFCSGLCGEDIFQKWSNDIKMQSKLIDQIICA